MPSLKEGARLALGLLCAAPAAYASVSCNPDRSICLEGRASASGVELWIDNRRAGSVTLSLELDARNIAFGRGDRDFALAGGRQKILAGKFPQPGRPWSLRYRFFAQPGLARARHDDRYAYALPFAPERAVRVSQGFHGGFSHNDETNAYAIDFDVPEGTPVYAAREGKVVEVTQSFRDGGPAEPLGNANVIKIEHPDHTVAEYAHLRFGGAAVRAGQSVGKSQLIGYSGDTGRTNGAHLHFAVHVPVSGRSRRSIPIRFATDEGGETVLRQGKEYRSPGR